MWWEKIIFRRTLSSWGEKEGGRIEKSLNIPLFLWLCEVWTFSQQAFILCAHSLEVASLFVMVFPSHTYWLPKSFTKRKSVHGWCLFYCLSLILTTVWKFSTLLEVVPGFIPFHFLSVLHSDSVGRESIESPILSLLGTFKTPAGSFLIDKQITPPNKKDLDNHPTNCPSWTQLPTKLQAYSINNQNGNQNPTKHHNYRHPRNRQDHARRIAGTEHWP